jgi:hypothetical protein
MRPVPHPQSRAPRCSEIRWSVVFAEEEMEVGIVHILEVGFECTGPTLVHVSRRSV